MADPRQPEDGGATTEERSLTPRGAGAFLAELRRRKVLRAIVVYGTAAFAVLQVVEPVMHGLHLPDWVLSAVVVILGLGFPVTTGLAWAFDFEPSGVVRTPEDSDRSRAAPRGTRLALLLLALGLATAAPGVAWHFLRGAGSTRVREAPPAASDPLTGARFWRLTDLDGIEQAAAVSRDGTFVAFQGDRGGRMDVWVTQVGTGQFVDLTHGSAPGIVNPSVRTLGFSPDGSLVTVWEDRSDGNDRPGIATWAIPLLGGPARPYLDGVAEHDWSRDGSRLVFHTPAPGDPMFVAERGHVSEARPLHRAPEGMHAHFPVWSPDDRHVYFVQGALPDHLDVWRILATGGEPERLTHHDAVVSHPVFLDTRTMLYLATDPDGQGPWIHALDLETRASRRLGAGVDAFSSLAATADGRRVVATAVVPRGTLWRVPLSGRPATPAEARRVPVSTGSASFPRLGPGFLLYVSSSGGADVVWRLQDGASSQIWSAPDARLLGAPAVSPDGSRVAFSVRQGGQTKLYVVGADGGGARVLAHSLALRGAPAWAPDGRSLTVAALVDAVPRLHRIPIDGGEPSVVVAAHSVDPAWSPDGDVVVYTGADVGTRFPVKGARADGSPAPLPALTLARGGRHLAFVPGRRALLVLRGEMGRKDLWEVDLDSGAWRQVTALAPDFDVRDFDVSADGREAIVQQVQDRSDIVIIDLPRR